MRKKPTAWRLNNILLKKQRVNEEIKKEIKKYLETNDNEETALRIYGIPQKQCSEGNSKQHRPSSKKKKNLKSTS